MSRAPFETAQQETLDLRAYVRPMWRRKWLIGLVVVLATAATYLLSARQHKKYVASTSVYVTVADPAAEVGSSTAPGPPTAQQMEDFANLMTAQAINLSVYRRLGRPLGSAGSVNVAPLASSSASAANTSFIVVTATSSTAALAAQLANAYVTVFFAAQRAAEAAAAGSAIRAAQTSLNTLTNIPANAPERQALLVAISQYRTIALNPSAGAKQVDPAVPPRAPSSPRPIRDALFAAIISLLLAIGLAFGLELLDRRLVQVSAFEAIYDRPVLAALPHVRNAAPLIDGHASVPDAFVENLRGLRVNLRFAGADRAPQVLLVTSGLPSEGKSTVARDLALAYADAGERALVIDADLRRPTMLVSFGLDEDLDGLVQVLRGELTLAHAVVAVQRPTVGDNGSPATRRGSSWLDVLAHGERVENPVVLLSSRMMKDVIRTASRNYDVVIIDTAPLLAVPDTVPLLSMVDAVLLVARYRLTTQEAAERTSITMRRAEAAHVAGVVVNDVRAAFLDGGAGQQYGQYRGYGYGAGTHSSGRRSATPS